MLCIMVLVAFPIVLINKGVESNNHSRDYRINTN